MMEFNFQLFDKFSIWDEVGIRPHLVRLLLPLVRIRPHLVRLLLPLVHILPHLVRLLPTWQRYSLIWCGYFPLGKDTPS